MKNLTFITLSGILLLATFLRLYNITSVPPSASLDEASIGYNAYSILETGLDEYGTFPILLRAYDDWRPAMHVYATTPFVKIFGLNILSVRLPAVMLSILTVAAVYFLVYELFRISQRTVFLASRIALLTSLFLAISPWHIYISRLGHEVNEGLSFAVFGMLFFLKRRIYLSSIFFALSFMSYHSEKIFIPGLFLGMFFIFKKDILEMKKKVVIALVLALIILSPFIKETFSSNGLIRLKGTNVFNAQSERFNKQAIRLAKAVKENDWLGKIIYNRRVLAASIFAEGYISHFDPRWLFTNASSDRHKVPNLGLLYVWEIPLIFIGIVFLILYKFDIKTKKLIFLWLFLSPIPAALTTDAPHAMRSFTFLPMWQVFSALGVFWVINAIPVRSIKRFAYPILGLVVIISLIYLYRQYFIIFPKTQSRSFQYALSKTIPFILENEKFYNKIVFSNQDNLYQSYMFFLFYSKYDPLLYQREGGTKSGGFAKTHKFGKYEFRPIHFLEEEKSSIIVGNVIDFPTYVKRIKTFYNLDGEGIIAVATK